MARAKTLYRCSECGAQHVKWSGQCADCDAWNTLVEESPVRAPKGGFAGSAGARATQDLSEVAPEAVHRVSSGVPELDRVLGGGLVPGSVVLLGGDPGIGKSTLLLQMLAAAKDRARVLYLTGEESLEQVALRAARLKVATDGLRCVAETSVEATLATIAEHRPEVLVIDSIQTMNTESLQSAPGSVAQVRDSAAALVRVAKERRITVILVGHVTKQGGIAGPRVLEHMVDAVLYFEGQSDGRYRAVRALKNRFGAANELGVFAMTETGLKSVSNPSALFLSSVAADRPGSVVLVSREGTRPLLVEIQALVAQGSGGSPRRLAVGIDPQRLAMQLAVLQRHGGVAVADQDVFVNVVGGLRIEETGADLALALAVASSALDRAVPLKTCAFGEIGLAGEVRPVFNGQERIAEARKQGFEKTLLPLGNIRKGDTDLQAVANVSDVVRWLQEHGRRPANLH